MIPPNGSFKFIETDTNGLPATVPNDATHMVFRSSDNNAVVGTVTYTINSINRIMVVPLGEFVAIYPLLEKGVNGGIKSDSVGSVAVTVENISFYKYELNG